MFEHLDFFEQLRRGELPAGSLDGISQLHRIPAKPATARRQVKQLIEHAFDSVDEAVWTIDNIIRWHGSELIWPKIRPGHRALMARLRAIVDPKTNDG